MKNLSTEQQKTIEQFQQNEITEYFVYKKLAKIAKDPHNAKILSQIADDEMEHYKFWKVYGKKDVKANNRKIMLFVFLARVLGLTFSLKFMEKGEENAQVVYSKFEGIIENVDQVIADEGKHEQALIGVLKEQKLEYMGSVVLGLNDALVELTGALTGLTLALQDMKLIALSGLVTGIAASFSMGASEYLSQSTDGNPKALTASIYTRIAYFFTVVALIMPYLFCQNPFIALAITLTIAIVIIAGFNFYVSVAKSFSFKERFFKMTIISLGIAGLSFVIGLVLKNMFGLNV